jgi:dephospho-CoA kinase
MIIGLTGLIGSGKTTLLNIYRQLGCSIFNSDKYINNVLLKDDKIKAQIFHYFPSVNVNNKVDKVMLSRVVFENYYYNIAILEKILHPLVISKVNKLIARQKFLFFRPLVLEIPLLFETKLDSYCDYIVFSHADKEIILNRVLSRGSVSFDNLLKILDKQALISEYSYKASYTFNTEKNLKELKKEIKISLKSMKKELRVKMINKIKNILLRKIRKND